MPSEIYEVVAQGARYWFLFLMALIAWRSWRWYRRDKRQMKKRLRLLPDAGYVGEMVVTDGGGIIRDGAVFPVPWEGTLGSLRTNDLSLPVTGVARRHLWMRFDEGRGLLIEPFAKNAVTVDGQAFTSRRDPLYMAHGSRLRVGEVELRLRLFAGFEGVGRAAYVPDAPEQEMEAQQPDQAAAMANQQMMMQQMLLQQQWLMQEMARQQAARQAAYSPEETAEPDDASQPIQRDDRIFMRPEGERPPQWSIQEQEAACVPDEPAEASEVEENPEQEGDWPYAPNPWADEEDLTDAAAELPRSAYVGHDEAARAKRQFWDRYFGGGQR